MSAGMQELLQVLCKAATRTGVETLLRLLHGFAVWVRYYTFLQPCMLGRQGTLSGVCCLLSRKKYSHHGLFQPIQGFSDVWSP